MYSVLLGTVALFVGNLLINNSLLLAKCEPPSRVPKELLRKR
jgi:hypothetical protein